MTTPETPTTHVGFLVFPGVQQLDLTGPHDVLSQLPGVKCHLVWKTLDPVASSSGLTLVPDETFTSCPALDVICIPGGVGTNDLLLDPETIAWVRRVASTARYVTSVCTGSLVLGAAGLLRGKRATTHWASHPLLAATGAIPTKARVVRDGNLFTGGGVTAGIDFGLTIAAELAGDQAARTVQLYLEYAPDPPFDAGSPDTAPREVLDKVMERNKANVERRQGIIERAMKMHAE